MERIAQTNKRTRDASLRRINQALRVAVPQLEQLELWREPTTGVPHLRGKYQHWRPQGAWQTEERFSDGTLRLLGLLWILLEAGGPLLLEEPELSLHPEIVTVIPQMFVRMQRRSGRQVLVSTHSAALLADPGIGLDEVHLLRPGKDGTEVEAACSIGEVAALLEGGLNMGQAVLPRTQPKDRNPRQLALALDR
jgi:predicted ATPase